MSTIDPEILDYYTRRAEETRLLRGLSQLEAERTRDLIRRHTPTPPATILDVGGAAGAYAFWLSDAGYVVHLIDPVPRLIGEAHRLNESVERRLASISIGDARRLPCADGVIDALLMLGPLYHLTSAEDREAALAEAWRVLRPGGVIFAAAISRWASTFDGLVDNTLDAPDFAAEVERALAYGQHRNPQARDGLFTTAYFHRPEELRAELAVVGFDVVALYGIEGPARMLADFESWWADPRRRAEMLRLAALVEEEPSLLGLSSHLLGVGRKSALLSAAT